MLTPRTNDDDLFKIDYQHRRRFTPRGYIKDADELQRLANFALDQTQARDTLTDSLKQIEMRFHVKWLGDFYLPHLSQKDWWGRLEKVGSPTKRQVQYV